MYFAIGVEPTKETARTLGVGQDRIDRGAAAVDEVEDALRAAGLLEELTEHDRGERDLLARFQDEGVAAGDREWIHPERDHGREVERRDAGADAEELKERLAVDVAGDVSERVAEEQRGYAAGVLDVIEAAEKAAACLGVGLAVFA